MSQRRRSRVTAAAAVAAIAVLGIVLLGPRLTSGKGPTSPSAAVGATGSASVSSVARASTSPPAAYVASAVPTSHLWTFPTAAPSPTPIGSFIATGSMTTLRGFHTATCLDDGRVLIAGGLDGTTTALASAELYDPETLTFSATGSMSTAREEHTATLLADGRVLVVGGQDGSGAVLTSAELYNPATGMFSPTGSLATPRTSDTATRLLDGRVLITGGLTSDDASLATAELYDPATGTFSPTGSMSTPRWDHSATLLLDGMVLIAGGEDRMDASGRVLASAELYDPQSGTFSATGSMVTARWGSVSARLLDGRVLIAGGEIGFEPQAELYDPASGAFRKTGPETSQDVQQSSSATLLPDGRVLLVVSGGSEAQLYEPEFGDFDALAGAPMKGMGGSTATLLARGSVLIAGGASCMMGRCAAYDTGQLYNP
jgi:hypothetical protein